MQLKVQKLTAKAILPTKGTDGSAGYDLYLSEDLDLSQEDNPNTDVVTAHFGVAVGIPKGFVGLLCERSSSHKKNFSLKNKVGVIDSDYRGELMAKVGVKPLDMFKDGTNILPAGTRIAQLVIIPTFDGTIEESDCLSITERGEGGFGSTDAA